MSTKAASCSNVEGRSPVDVVTCRLRLFFEVWLPVAKVEITAEGKELDKEVIARFRSMTCKHGTDPRLQIQRRCFEMMESVFLRIAIEAPGWS